MQSLQSAMLGYGVFAALHRVVGTRPLSLAENVIVQTTSVATATMPLAAGMGFCHVGFVTMVLPHVYSVYMHSVYVL